MQNENAKYSTWAVIWSKILLVQLEGFKSSSFEQFFFFLQSCPIGFRPCG